MSDAYVWSPKLQDMSKNNCCVVGCSNTYKNSSATRFYSFPARPHERERRKQWIAAVRRESADGTPWQPTKHSKICSRHFVNGEKSNDPRSPAYLPTLFPKVYMSTKVPSAHRYERLWSREQHEEPVSSCVSPIPGDQEWGGAMEEHTSVGTQTDPCTWFSPVDMPSIFLCYLKEGQAETQAVLPPKKKARMHRGEHPAVSRTLHVTV